MRWLLVHKTIEKTYSLQKENIYICKEKFYKEITATNKAKDKGVQLNI